MNTRRLIVNADDFGQSKGINRGIVECHERGILTSTSLIAQWMMTRKILENWILWIVVDIVYVPMFISQGLYATALLYAAFLVLAMFGFVEWRRSVQPLSVAT